MDLEITPEPSEAERQAIAEALRLEGEADRGPSPWRRAGLDPEASQTFADLGARPDATGARIAAGRMTARPANR